MSLIGTNIQVMVKKPGKTYYSYSSLRTVYNLAGLPAWQYKYYFKAGMVKGYYTFYAFVPASSTHLYSRSPNLTIRLRYERQGNHVPREVAAPSGSTRAGPLRALGQGDRRESAGMLGPPCGAVAPTTSCPA